MHRIQIRQNKKCRQSLLPFPPSNLPLKKRTFRRPRDPDGLSEPRMLQGRVPPQNGARRIWSGRGARRHWTSGARSYGTWRHYGALKQATQPRFSSFRCQLNLSGGALAGKKDLFLLNKRSISNMSVETEISRQWFKFLTNIFGI